MDKLIDTSAVNVVLDKEAQSRSMPELRDIPHYQLEELLLQHKLDLTVEGITLGGMGQDSIGFKIDKGTEGKSFLKVFRLGIIPQEILIDFVQKSGVHRENLKDWKGEVISEDEFKRTLNEWTDSRFDDSKEGRESASRRKLFERQVLGIQKGNKLLPNRVPKLEGIWTWNGEPVAMTIEFKDGKGEPITTWNEEYSSDIKLLEENGIVVDDFFERDNSIRDENNNVWFIDLEYWPETIGKEFE